MASTSSRMLALLSLLQSQRFWSGRQLQERLEVSPRTLRRDIERLRDLGYSVESIRGSTGGYRLAFGETLPPLLVDSDDATVISRSEEHTSELQSRGHLVCRLLLEKKQ